MVCFYTPLPSFAFLRSSVDLHFRHRSALIALDAPHFMQIFLFNNRFSASGNRVIGYRLGVSRINILYLNMMPLLSFPVSECEYSLRWGMKIKPRKNRWKSLIFIFFFLFFIWVLLQFLAPLVLPPGSVLDLSGVVGFSDNDQVIGNMSFPWNVVYTSGDRLCHQQADRSLFLNGNEMPFCTRCTAIWFGIVLGLGFMVFFTIELNEKFVAIILLGLIPIGIDGVGQLLGFWESTNLIRFITGLLAGVVCGVAIGVIIDEIKTIRIDKASKK